jgi:hypothetical protein
MPRCRQMLWKARKTPSSPRTTTIGASPTVVVTYEPAPDSRWTSVTGAQRFVKISRCSCAYQSGDANASGGNR